MPDTCESGLHRYADEISAKMALRPQDHSWRCKKCHGLHITVGMAVSKKELEYKVPKSWKRAEQRKRARARNE